MKYIIVLLCILSINLCNHVIITSEVNDDINPHSFYKRKSDSNHDDDINPHSFYYDKHSKKIVKSRLNHVETKKMDLLKKAESGSCEANLSELLQRQSDNINYETYYTRLINMLLANILIKENISGYLEGVIGVEASNNDLSILQNYKNEKIPINEVDQILNRIIIKPTQSFTTRIINHLLDNPILDYLIENKFIVCVTISTTFLAIIMWKNCTSTSSMVIFIVMCVLSYSWYITHQDMVNEVEINKRTNEEIYSEMPLSCKPSKMWWYQKLWIVNLFFVQPSQEDCKEYIKAHKTVPLREVTLLMSFIKMLSDTIFQPLPVYGNFLNKLIKNLTKNTNIFVETLIWIIIICGHCSIPLWFIMKRFSIITPFTTIIFDSNSSTVPQRIETITPSSHKKDIQISWPEIKTGKMSLNIEYTTDSENQNRSSQQTRRKDKPKRLSIKSSDECKNKNCTLVRSDEHNSKSDDNSISATAEITKMNSSSKTVESSDDDETKSRTFSSHSEEEDNESESNLLVNKSKTSKNRRTCSNCKKNT